MVFGGLVVSCWQVRWCAKFNGGEVTGYQSIERNQTKFNSDKNNRAVELNQAFDFQILDF